MFILRVNAEPLLGKVTDSSDNLSAPASPLKVLGLWDGSQAHTTPDLWDSFPGVLVVLWGWGIGWAHWASVPLDACSASLPRTA